MIKDKAINIVDMNLKYSQLVSFLLEASQNKADSMQSYLLPFGDATNVKRDVVLDELLKPHAVDDTVEIILKVTLPAITKVCQHLFTDHLQGGKYADIDMAGRNVLAGTPKHNKFSESVFGFVDHMVRAKPNICTFSTEAYVMFAQQQDWCLASREGCEHPVGNPQGSFLDVKRVRASFAKRREEIVTARRAKVQAALKKAEELKAKKLQQLEQYTNDIIEFGLWQSEKAVDEELVRAKHCQPKRTSCLPTTRLVPGFKGRMRAPSRQSSRQLSRCEESESVIRETAGRDCHRPKSEGEGSLEESRRAEGQEAAATRAVYQ